MVQYVQKDVLTTLCAEQIDPNLGTLLVEVVASVLDNEVNIKNFIFLKIISIKLAKKKEFKEDFINFLLYFFYFIFFCHEILRISNHFADRIQLASLAL